MHLAKVGLFILGSQKCGTTSLADFLNRSSQFFAPSVKETYFFCDESHFANGIDWYHREFYSTAKATSAQMCCDATPFYLASSQAIDRIASYSDAQTRHVVLLRDPVERAYSAWLHQIRLGNEPLDFHTALLAEEDRVAEARANGGRWWRHGYATVGCYGAQLQYAFQQLGRDNVLVLPQAVLGNAAQLAAQLDAHLGTSLASEALEVPHSNKAANPRSRALQSLINKNNPLKKLAKRLVPREMRSKLGHSINRLNASAATDAAKPTPQSIHFLREKLAKDMQSLAALNVTAQTEWTLGARWLE